MDSADDLYGLPLDRFIPERADLAKRLRGDKRREEAAEVAARRKPSVAAWAVNQLVRTQAKQLDALFSAGDDLARAQAGAASGQRAADAMRDATHRQREALDELVETARGLLSSDGHPLSPTTLDRVTDTLRAASIDEDSRQQVAGGCLTQELAFAGLGIGELPVAAPASPQPTKAQPKQGTRGKAKQTGKPKTTGNGKQPAKAKRPTKAKQTTERKAALKAARQAEAKARRAATRAERELTTAEGRRESAAEALEEAERILAGARDRAQSTAAELTKAERAVRKLAGAS